MDNQPAPISDEKVACINCRFARLVRMSPSDLRKQLTCRFLPPQNVIATGPNGPVLLGSGFATVTEHTWCFQFSRAESRAEVEGEHAPESTAKLIAGNGKSILNG